MNDKEISSQSHEGEHYLNLLGMENLAGKKIETANGTLEVRDFLEVCGEYARPIFVGFESMDTNDPRYETTKDMLRGIIGKYINADNTNE